MNFLRTATIVLIAILVPGGLIVLLPTIYRFFVELRNRRPQRVP
jgi:hypothetical protein